MRRTSTAQAVGNRNFQSSIVKIKNAFQAVLVAAFTSASVPVVRAGESTPEEKKEGVKPDKLDTCIVSDEKLGEMSKP